MACRRSRVALFGLLLGVSMAQQPLYQPQYQQPYYPVQYNPQYQPGYNPQYQQQYAPQYQQPYYPVQNQQQIPIQSSVNPKIPSTLPPKPTTPLPPTAGEPTGIMKGGCNGSPLFCQLRYDQYTFAGTYKSGSYNLQPDCNSGSLGGNLANCANFFRTFACYYSSQGGRFPSQSSGDGSVLQQLGDGIRAFHFNICALTRTGFSPIASLCDILSGFRQFGDTVDTALNSVQAFLNFYKSEIVTIEFDQVDNAVIAQSVIDTLNTRFPNQILTVSGANFPTLGQMVQQNTRLVVFVSNAFAGGVQSPPAWMLRRDQYYLPASTYTVPNLASAPSGLSGNDLANFVNNVAATIPTLISQFCTQPSNALAGRWQALDFEYPQLNICPSRVSNTVNQLITPTCLDCTAVTFFHRIRVSHYTIGVNLRRLVFAVNYARLLYLGAANNASTTV